LSDRAGSLPAAGANVVHVVVDMQRLFAEETPWQVASFGEILPAVRKLIALYPEQTLFTRFTTPPSPEAASGSWRDFYRRWEAVTLAKMPKEMIDLVAPLAGTALPAQVFDKPTYSAFAAEAFRAELRRRGAEVLIVSGVETDVCVLATVFDAVDAGLQVVVVPEAVTSGVLAGHAAVLDHVLPHLQGQVSIVPLARRAGAPA
jgi:nicotinamidase-related amidase